eukprot:gene4962-3914_t
MTQVTLVAANLREFLPAVEGAQVGCVSECLELQLDLCEGVVAQ